MNLSAVGKVCGDLYFVSKNLFVASGKVYSQRPR